MDGGIMDTGMFDGLLGLDLGSRLIWEASHRCPCGEDGAAELSCPVCLGQGRFFDPPSDEFRAGLVGLSAKAMERMAIQYGPGLIGDATVSIPQDAFCYTGIGQGDRLLALDAVDTLEWTLSPRTPVRLPAGSILQESWVRDGSQVLRVPPPSPADDGTVVATRSQVVRFQAPRRYEVLRDLSQIRAWQTGLPKKLLLKLIDVTTR